MWHYMPENTKLFKMLDSSNEMNKNNKFVHFSSSKVWTEKLIIIV